MSPSALSFFAFLVSKQAVFDHGNQVRVGPPTSCQNWGGFSKCPLIFVTTSIPFSDKLLLLIATVLTLNISRGTSGR